MLLESHRCEANCCVAFAMRYAIRERFTRFQGVSSPLSRPFDRSIPTAPGSRGATCLSLA